MSTKFELARSALLSALKSKGVCLPAPEHKMLMSDTARPWQRHNALRAAILAALKYLGRGEPKDLPGELEKDEVGEERAKARIRDMARTADDLAKVLCSSRTPANSDGQRERNVDKDDPRIGQCLAKAGHIRDLGYEQDFNGDVVVSADRSNTIALDKLSHDVLKTLLNDDPDLFSAICRHLEAEEVRLCGCATDDQIITLMRAIRRLPEDELEQRAQSPEAAERISKARLRDWKAVPASEVQDWIKLLSTSEPNREPKPRLDLPVPPTGTGSTDKKGDESVDSPDDKVQQDAAANAKAEEVAKPLRDQIEQLEKDLQAAKDGQLELEDFRRLCARLGTTEATAQSLESLISGILARYRVLCDEVPGLDGQLPPDQLKVDFNLIVNERRKDAIREATPQIKDEGAKEERVRQRRQRRWWKIGTLAAIILAAASMFAAGFVYSSAVRAVQTLKRQHQQELQSVQQTGETP